MLRLLTAVSALAFCAGALVAEEYKGTFKSVTDTKITVTISDKDKTFALDKDPLVLKDDNKAKALPGGLKSIKAGTPVTIITETRDQVETVVTIKAKAGKKKKKDN